MHQVAGRQSPKAALAAMSKVDYISVKGFKSLSDVEELKLNGVNVLIGANGSGKSNFVEAFAFLRALRRANLAHYVAAAGGASRLLHFGATRTDEMTFKVSFASEVNQYEIKLVATDDDGLRPIAETAYFWNKDYKRPHEENLDFGREAGISVDASERDIPSHVQQHLDSWVRYQFDDTSRRSPIRLTANVNDNRRLRADASNLAPFLYRLGETHRGSLSLIERTIRLVAPFFDGFALEPDAVNDQSIRLQWRHAGSDAYFDAAALSDGTLRFMALATLMLQPGELRPSVILLDEPELGMHPYAIAVLASMIKSVSVESQVVLATQSSTLLDQFKAEDILVADRNDGATRLQREDGERLRPWLERYSLGQLWEKNEIGGRPAQERPTAG